MAPSGRPASLKSSRFSLQRGVLLRSFPKGLRGRTPKSSLSSSAAVAMRRSEGPSTSRSLRTTLKRGTGRGGQANGRIPRPPGPPSRSAPPPPPGPMTRYAAWRRSRLRLGGQDPALAPRRRARRGRSARRRRLALPERERGRGRAALGRRSRRSRTRRSSSAPLPGQPTTAIIIGYDKRARAPRASVTSDDPTRSCSCGPTRSGRRSRSSRSRATSSSTTRAARATRPGATASTPRTPTAARRGTVRTVKALTGIPINYALVVNFHGFKEIVNKVGGVYVDVDHRYFNDNSRAGQVRDDQPPARLPEADGRRGSRLRALPAHGLRLPSRRPPAGVRQGVQAAGAGELQRHSSCRGSINAIVHNLEVVKGGKKAGSRERGPRLRAVHLRAAGRALLPGPHRRHHRLRGADRPTGGDRQRRCGSS